VRASAPPMGRTPGISEPHFTSRDRQIRNCVMIHRTTTAMISIAIDQVMTSFIAHIVEDIRDTDDQRRWMPHALLSGRGGDSARAAAGYRFFWCHFSGEPSPGPGSSAA
jgi:hypothetical protein